MTTTERAINDIARGRAVRRLHERHAQLRRAFEHEDIAVAVLTQSEADEMLSQHPADMGSVLELTEQAVGNRELVRSELRSVEDALERVAHGSYGRCQQCGRDIAAERLEALPYASRCVDCQRAYERTHRSR